MNHKNRVDCHRENWQFALFSITGLSHKILTFADNWRPKDKSMAEFNDIQIIKRKFFTLRNGALADNMRRQGAPYRIIFGLNLPQLVRIASETPCNESVAQSLWENTSTRESMLLAPMIYPRECFTIDKARIWISQSPTAEVTDILCHKLLRYTDFAGQLATELAVSAGDMQRYTALRLMFNLLPSDLQQAKNYATAELQRNCTLTASLCRSMLDEIGFLEEPRTLT